MTILDGIATRADLMLGRVTMYRLVTVALSAIALTGLGLSVLGRLAFGPVALLSSAGVLLATTYLSGRLFAWMFGAGQHAESAAITALVLLLILPPTPTVVGLGATALAGIVATGSKYLLAFRGRHLFNPAALAAAYLGLVGVTHATWWVATPLMLPVTVLAGATLLFRIRQLPLAAVFLATSIPLITVRAMASGLGIGAAVWQAVSSWPLIFFAAFMLSEPLTLPPRRAQQWAVGGLVGILIALPAHLGPLSMSPEIALLIGNLTSFLIARRVGINLVVTGRRALAASSIELTLAPTRRLAFAAGQYVELTVPHPNADSRGTRRVFSIASPPVPDGSIRVGLRIPEDASSFKRALATLPTGSAISATMVAGDFTLPDRFRRAAGVGGRRNRDHPVRRPAGPAGQARCRARLRARQRVGLPGGTRCDGCPGGVGEPPATANAPGPLDIRAGHQGDRTDPEGHGAGSGPPRRVRIRSARDGARRRADPALDRSTLGSHRRILRVLSRRLAGGGACRS